MINEQFSFFNQNIKLAGTLYKPNSNQPSPAIVVVHHASGGEQSDPFYNHLKNELPKHGIAVLVFDRRGSGASEGDFESVDFEELAGDVVSAVEYLESRPDIDKSKIGLHGTSQGGWIAPIAAVKKPDIAYIIAVSASGVSPARQMDYGVAFHLEQDGFDKNVIDKTVELRGLVNEYFRGQVSRDTVLAELRRYESEPWFEKGYLYSSDELPVDITQSKWFHEMDYEPLSVWKEVAQPTLFLFAEIDEWVPVEESMENYRLATSQNKDVTMKQILGSDHLMSKSQDKNIHIASPEYLNIVTGWLKSRL
ncbi:MAG TPA: hypothetical protein DCX53_15095 [Anaerolineae bacterium]|nr:hypothetical protein [Anaerolineae bacterium]